MVAITLPDGSVREFDGPVSAADVAAAIGPGLAKAALAAVVDGEMRDLATAIKADAAVSIVTAKSDEALELIRPLIERVIMRPVEGGFEIELVGAIANMLQLTQTPSTEPKNAANPTAKAADVDDPFVSSVKVVAGARKQRESLIVPIDL